ncbi:MAG: ABC transporter permease subunit, partial [Caldilinea sp.]
MAVDQAQKGVAFQGGQDALGLARKPQTYWSMAFASLRRDKLTIVALSFIAVIGLLALGAGVLTNAIGVSPTQTNPANQFQQPYLIPYLQWMLGIDPLTAPTMLYKSGGATHWLGADQLGRDQLARLLYGARISLSIALVAAGLSMVLGVGVGAVAGYFGGRVDDVIMWFIATLTTIPEIYLLIIVNSIFRPTPLTLTLFLGFLGWFGTARFMRGNVFKVR